MASSLSVVKVVEMAMRFHLDPIEVIHRPISQNLFLLDVLSTIDGDILPEVGTNQEISSVVNYISKNKDEFLNNLNSKLRL